VALDERLRRELEHAARPADPSGVYEELIGRRVRRRLLRQIEAVGLGLVVVAGAVMAVLGLSRVFAPGGNQVSGGVRNGRIAFTNMKPEFAIPEVTAPWYLFTMEPDGSDVTFVGPRAVDEALYPTYSPDGRQIAFMGFTAKPEERALYLLNLESGSLSKIFTLDLRHQIDGLAWSPDGARIAMLYTQFVPTEPQLVSTIWKIAPDGSDLRQVTTVGRESDFSWSPDGSRIAFSRYEPIDPGDQDVANDIYLVDADGRGEERLTHDGRSSSPAWSPDGTRIAFESNEPDSSTGIDLWIMDADGTDRRRLTSDPGNEYDATWAPDGSSIAFGERAVDNEGSECYVSTIAPDGSDRTRLFGIPDDRGCPGENGLSWAPALTRAEGTVSRSPSTGPTGPTAPPSEDIGLGFPVCNVSSIDGHFSAPNQRATVFVATRAGDTGGCPAAEEAFNMVALDVDRDGFAESSFGPIECELECRTFSAPDINGDGTDELLVVQGGGAVVRAHLYDIASAETDPSVVPLLVAAPGDPEGGFEPGQQTTFLIGGDGFELDGVRCGEVPGRDGPGVIATRAESRPQDSPDAVWHAHETTLVWRDDGVMHVVAVRDFTEPVTDNPAGPSFRSGEMLCGSNLGPIVPAGPTG
jgi:WD40-like Beta Propeller Repeat